MLRVAIPVDDAWYTVQMRGPIVHVATRVPDEVEVWWLNAPTTPPHTREFIVVGTGHDIPAYCRHVGSAIVPSGTLVWHLFERVRPPDRGPACEP